MKILTLVGAILLAIGIAGTIWGVIKMYDDRDTIQITDDTSVVVDEGDFPLIGIGAAVIGAAGLVTVIIGVTAGRKSR